MLSFILNLPYTFVGLIMALISLPENITFKNDPLALIFKVKKLWWTFWYFNWARAVTIGHVVLMGPNIINKDLEHELIHVKQYQRAPFIYPFLYLIELFRNGYKNNKYEIEAYDDAGNVYMDR
ncbi:MAG TPA: hypothetical protein VJC12_03665 [Candidatus Paceibacterota bacterium]